MKTNKYITIYIISWLLIGQQSPLLSMKNTLTVSNHIALSTLAQMPVVWHIEPSPFCSDNYHNDHALSAQEFNKHRFKLWCGHLFCYQCLIWHYAQHDETIEGDTHKACPICKTFINKYLCHSFTLYDRYENMRLLALQWQSGRHKKYLMCSLLCGTLHNKERLKLKCKHNFCISCLASRYARYTAKLEDDSCAQCPLCLYPFSNHKKEIITSHPSYTLTLSALTNDSYFYTILFKIVNRNKYENHRSDLIDN